MSRSKTPEGAVLKAVMDYLAVRHVLAFRMNTLAMPTPDGKRFIKAGVVGMADILAFLNTSYLYEAKPLDGNWDVQQYRLQSALWLECKAGKGKQSEAQKAFQALVESHGHRYAVVRSIEDVEALL